MRGGQEGRCTESECRQAIYTHNKGMEGIMLLPDTSKKTRQERGQLILSIFRSHKYGEYNLGDRYRKLHINKSKISTDDPVERESTQLSPMIYEENNGD